MTDILAKLRMRNAPFAVGDLIDEAADEIECQQAEIERLRATLGECLTREAKIQKILDGLNTHLAAWREDY